MYFLVAWFSYTQAPHTRLKAAIATPMPRIVKTLSLAVFLASACSAYAQTTNLPDAAPSVFDIPGIIGVERLAAGLVQVGDVDAAEKALAGLLSKYPSLAIVHLDLAL